MLDSLSNLSTDKDEESQGWLAPKPRNIKKKFSKPVVATRFSKRIPRDGIPIAEKASSRAVAKNTILGTSPSNPFVILSNTPSALLENVLSDLNIVVDDAEEQIGAFRAEELARAALAKANYKVF